MKISMNFKLLNEQPKETFYIYCFINPYTNILFYIGKGKNQRYRSHFRKSSLSTGNTLKNNTIKKILSKGGKVHIQFLFGSINEKEVLDKEASYIKEYGRIDLKTGTLTNLTEGGEGISGKVFTEKEREACRKRLSGKGNPMYGKKRTEEEKQAISLTRKKRISNGSIIPTRHSEEWKQHLKDNNAGGKVTSKPIYQIDLETGKVLKEWSSSKQAGENLKIEYSNILTSANKEDHTTPGGFLWRFKTSFSVKNGLLQNILGIKKIKEKPKAAKSIHQIDPSTLTIIKTWQSAQEVYRQLKINYAGVSSVCLTKMGPRGYRTAGGFIWRLTTDCEFE